MHALDFPNLDARPRQIHDARLCPRPRLAWLPHYLVHFPPLLMVPWHPWSPTWACSLWFLGMFPHVSVAHATTLTHSRLPTSHAFCDDFDCSCTASLLSRPRHLHDFKLKKPRAPPYISTCAALVPLAPARAMCGVRPRRPPPPSTWLCVQSPGTTFNQHHWCYGLGLGRAHAHVHSGRRGQKVIFYLLLLSPCQFQIVHPGMGSMMGNRSLDTIDAQKNERETIEHCRKLKSYTSIAPQMSPQLRKVDVFSFSSFMFHLQIHCSTSFGFDLAPRRISTIQFSVGSSFGLC